MPIVDSPYRNPGRWRAVVYRAEVRHGTAGCMLSLVLLAPLLVRVYGLPTVLAVVVVYSVVVVPVATNYYSLSGLLLKFLRSIFHGCPASLGYAAHPGVLTTILYSVTSSACWVIASISSVVRTAFEVTIVAGTCLITCFLARVHQYYVSFEGFRITSNQIVFFLLCEKLQNPSSRMLCIYYLLFYTILTYLYKSLTTRPWTQMLHETDTREFLILTTWYIAVRLGKGVAMSFVLVMFTIKFNDEDLDVTYIATTFLYFIVTEKQWMGGERIVAWSRLLSVDFFEEEEEFWIPVVLKALPIISSGVVGPVLLMQGHYLLCAIALYTNIVVPLEVLQEECSSHSVQHTESLLKYRMATRAEVSANPTCPVCLEALRVARATPCGHLYHGVCLRKCLALSRLCPLCKQEI